MTIPIPARKPTFSSSNGNEAGFLDSILTTVESLSNSAFNVSANYLRVKQMFDGDIPVDSVNGQGAEVPNSVNNPSLLTSNGGISNTTLIGAGLAVVGLFVLMDD